MIRSGAARKYSQGAFDNAAPLRIHTGFTFNFIHMDELTPSKGIESNATPDAAVEETTDTPEGIEQQVDVEEGTPAQPEEKSLSADDLLAEMPEPEKPPPDTESPKEHQKKESSKFADRRDEALEAIYAVRGESDDTAEQKNLMEKKLNSYPPDFARYLRKEMNKLESGQDRTDPEDMNRPLTRADMKAYAEQREDQIKFKELYPRLCSTAGLDKDTAHNTKMRTRLLQEAQKMQGVPLSEAIQYVYARAGLLNREALAEAQKKGAKLARTALPNAGNPPKNKSSHKRLKDMTADEIDSMSDNDFSNWWKSRKK